MVVIQKGPKGRKGPERLLSATVDSNQMIEIREPRSNCGRLI